MYDFTYKAYYCLLKSLQNKDYLFQTFEEYLKGNEIKAIIIRHDVDMLPANSLKISRIESELGIYGSYYFRMKGGLSNLDIIRQIVDLGHEVGYHYETMDTCKGDVDQAYNLFCLNLEKLRKLVPVKTICMHGSPLSKYDNRQIWQKFDYDKLGIIGEPYFDIDFNKVMYLTDTGRCWDGDSFNVRDKTINRKEHIGDAKIAKEDPQQPATTASSVALRRRSNQQPAPFPKFHSTFDIIKSSEAGTLPDQIMMTFHPQRWTDKPLPWVMELVWQNVKNVVKFFFIRMRAESSR